MTDRQTKYVRMPNGLQYEVTVENQSSWGAWVQRVVVRGPGPNAPEGPRMSDTGDPPQDCADETKMTPAQRAAWRTRGLFGNPPQDCPRCYGAGCVRCTPDGEV